MKKRIGIEGVGETKNRVLRKMFGPKGKKQQKAGENNVLSGFMLLLLVIIGRSNQGE